MTFRFRGAGNSSDSSSDSPGRSWAFPGAPGRTGALLEAWTFQGAPGALGRSGALLGAPGRSWALLGAPGLSWALFGAVRSWALLGAPRYS